VPDPPCPQRTEGLTGVFASSDKAFFTGITPNWDLHVHRRPAAVESHLALIHTPTQQQELERPWHCERDLFRSRVHSPRVKGHHEKTSLFLSNVTLPFRKFRKFWSTFLHTLFETNQFRPLHIFSGCGPLSHRSPIARYPALRSRNGSRLTSQSNNETSLCINACLISTINNAFQSSNHLEIDVRI
jgi:hypothetical protein